MLLHYAAQTSQVLSSLHLRLYNWVRSMLLFVQPMNVVKRYPLRLVAQLSLLRYGLYLSQTPGRR